MQRKLKTILGFLILTVMILNICCGVGFADETDAKPETEKIAGEMDEVSLVPGKNNAYVVFSDPIQSNMIKYKDGLTEGITDSQDPTWSEKFEMDNIRGRKVYRPNYVYFDIADEFAQEGDNRFMVMITFYDFGPDVGYFYFEYTSTDGDMHKRISIKKPGIVPKWTTVRYYIEDVDLINGMEYGCDMRLVSNAYNAFAKFEVINVDALERMGGGEDIELPVVSAIQEEALKGIGLYDGFDKDGNKASLEQNITRMEVLDGLMMATGNLSKVENAVTSTTFTDVNEKQAKTLAVAEELGLVSVPSDGKFNPDKIATPREIMTFYLRFLKIQDEDLYGNAPALSDKYVLKTPTDFILFHDKPAIRDHFVALTYNALFIKDGKTREDILTSLVKSNKVSIEDLKNTGISKLAAYEYIVPFKIPMQTINDPVTGQTYKYVNFAGGKMVRPYVTQQHMNNAGTKFIFANDKTEAMYEYDMETEMCRYLDQTDEYTSSCNAHVTPDDQIYYRKGNQTWRMDWNTYETEKVSNTYFGVLCVTNDHKWMSGYFASTVARQNLETQEVEIVDEARPEHWKDNPSSQGVGHPLINPEYPELLFFCHEGTTTEIPDRLWLHNFETNDTYNFFVQAESETAQGKTGETSGHEVWSMDGEMMYWVKYTYDTNVGQSGLMRADKYGKTREYINGDFAFWHCYPSSDHNFVAGDTNKGQIALVDTRTKKSYYIAKFNMYSQTHPYQPHPNINYGNTKITWQMVDDVNMLGVGIADISDIVNTEVKGGREEFTEDAEVVSYADTASEVTFGEYANEDAVIVNKKNKLYVDLKDELVEGKDSVTIDITYYDYAKAPITINYSPKPVKSSDLAKFETQKYVIKKTDTKNWKTERITINDINLNNSCSYGTDIVITSQPMSQTVIKDIKIVS